MNFVGTLGFSIVIPFLVFMVTRLGGNALIYGLMGSTYSAFQLIGAPLLGRWSDSLGRKKILLLSLPVTLGLAIWILGMGAVQALLFSLMMGAIAIISLTVVLVSLTTMIGSGSAGV